ncbi:MAG: hypothetical protein MUE85_17365 [Microscillaceae bacterium]|jgi:hypothetical protein|nr:hypothetical protein [Microscillaceae bacterium]
MQELEINQLESLEIRNYLITRPYPPLEGIQQTMVLKILFYICFLSVVALPPLISNKMLFVGHINLLE